MRIPYVVVILLALTFPFCTSTQKVNTGEMAFEYKQYHKAIQLLKDEVNKSSLKDEVARKSFLIAISYERLEDVPAALIWYQRAYENGYGDQALFKYAQMLKRDGQYSSAINVLTRLSQSERANTFYRRELTITRQAMEWANTDQRAYEVESLGFNSAHSDFQLQLSAEGILYFTSDRRSSTGDELYHWTGQKFMDVYEIRTAELKQEAELTQLPINTKEHESTPTFHKEGRDMVFCRCAPLNLQYNNYCILYHAVKSDGKWKNFEILPFIQEGHNYMHPVFSADGKQMFFSSDMPDGFGRYDLWSVRFENGSWGIPVNLGKRINSEGQEVFPTIHEDTLYFSSDYRAGLGGLDIFKTHFSSTLGWIPPAHLPYPINSGGDDMSFISGPIPNLKENEGLFVSSRQGGEGADDIYLFRKYELKEDTTEKEPTGLELEITVKGEIYELINDPNSGVADYERIANASLSIVQEGNVQKANTNQRGIFTFEIEKDKDYFIMASKEGYLNRSVEFSSFGLSPEKRGTKTYLQEIILPQKIVNQEIVLKNIYYDFDEADIRPDAAKVLDSLASLFLDNPGLQIQLGSHTDCRGEQSYNYDLSLRRAQSAVEYLISKGVDPARLEAKGYGESEPAVECECINCTEEEYQRNRRTTFKIIE